MAHPTDARRSTIVASDPVQAASRELCALQSPIGSLPELLSLGLVEVGRAVDHVLKPHFHSGLEIHYVERGSLNWWIGRERHSLEGGDLHLTWPGEVHGAVDGRLGPSRIHWVLIGPPDAGSSPPYLGLGQAGWDALIERLRSLPRRSFRARSDVLTCFRRLHDACELGETPVGGLYARAALVGLLMGVLESGQSASTRVHSRCVRQALEVMNRTEGPLDLEEVATRVGCSLSHLKHCFRAEVGMPPAQYLLHLRIERAHDLLLEPGSTVTRVAHQLGFSSSQNFAKAFRRLRGQTPSQSQSAAGTDPAQWRPAGWLSSDPVNVGVRLNHAERARSAGAVMTPPHDH